MNDQKYGKVAYQNENTGRKLSTGAVIAIVVAAALLALIIWRSIIALLG